MSDKKNVPLKTGNPVEGFPIIFTWQENEWKDIFDKQIELIGQDIKRAKSDNKIVIYLSCPISSRGGGHHATNVDIANHTERRLLQEWGEGFWFLNPSRYQLESNEGAGLLDRHIKALGYSLDQIKKLPSPMGGDYMRMWTKILVEDETDNAGLEFDGYYFIGPKDVKNFFSVEGTKTLTSSVENYFTRKYISSSDFRASYENLEEEEIKDFLRFYTLRASASFSKGCHDEWNIFTAINRKRLQLSATTRSVHGDVGELLAGYFDGEQIDPGIYDTSPGYAS